MHILCLKILCLKIQFRAIIAVGTGDCRANFARKNYDYGKHYCNTFRPQPQGDSRA